MNPFDSKEPTLPEEGTLRRFLRGDRAACAEVERWIWVVVRQKRLFGSPEESEDIVQDTLAGVWIAVTKRTFTLRRGFRALVREVAARKCIDQMRRRRPMAALDENQKDPSPSPYDLILKKDERARLRWALQGLGASCQKIIRLRFWEGLSYAQIEEQEQSSQGTLRFRMFECMKRLRNLLARWARA